MRTKQELAELRAQAVALRRAGRSRREIRDALQITSNSTLYDALIGEPAPGWTDPYHSRERAIAAHRAYYAAKRAERDAERAAVRVRAAAQIGELTPRELRIAGATAYWCEGAKSKPYRKNVQVSFINSDPGMILLFLRFLTEVGVGQDRLRFRVHIHERGDVKAATRWWASCVATSADQFIKPAIKRHRSRIQYPESPEYRGCLQISVLKSAALYRQIAGWVEGVAASKLPGEDSNPDLTPPKGVVLPLDHPGLLRLLLYSSAPCYADGSTLAHDVSPNVCVSHIARRWAGFM